MEFPDRTGVIGVFANAPPMSTPDNHTNKSTAKPVLDNNNNNNNSIWDRCWELLIFRFPPSFVEDFPLGRMQNEEDGGAWSDVALSVTGTGASIQFQRILFHAPPVH